MFRKYSHLYCSPPDEWKLKRKMGWVPKLCLQFHLLFCRAIPPMLIIKRFITVKMTTDSKLRYNLSVKVILYLYPFTWKCVSLTLFSFKFQLTLSFHIIWLTFFFLPFKIITVFDCVLLSPKSPQGWKFEIFEYTCCPQTE